MIKQERKDNERGISWRDLTIACLTVLAAISTYLGKEFKNEQDNMNHQIVMLHGEVQSIKTRQESIINLQNERLAVQEKNNDLLREDIKEIKDTLKEISVSVRR